MLTLSEWSFNFFHYTERMQQRVASGSALSLPFPPPFPPPAAVSLSFSVATQMHQLHRNVPVKDKQRQGGIKREYSSPVNLPDALVKFLRLFNPPNVTD